MPAFFSGLSRRIGRSTQANGRPSLDIERTHIGYLETSRRIGVRVGCNFSIQVFCCRAGLVGAVFAASAAPADGVAGRRPGPWRSIDGILPGWAVIGVSKIASLA